MNPRQPYATKPLLISCCGFKIVEGIFKVPLGNMQYNDVLLNSYVSKMLSDPSLKILSSTLTADGLSISISKEVAGIECTGVEGVDRNLRNLTVGDYNNVVQYDLSQSVGIAENTRSVIRSFKGNYIRIRKELWQVREKEEPNQPAITSCLQDTGKASKGIQERNCI
jgi:hypothetical protein